MKQLIAFCFIVIVGNLISQTNVSGGIYQNTTWTLDGSPYIVTGSIVVFPGKTLTIEPGCEVRFNADYTFNTGNFIYLEIRGTLIASGTDANKIKFTSSDTTDGFFNWQGISIRGSQGGNCQLDRFELHNSYFGIYNDVSEPGTIYNFTNCRFKNNNYALQLNADLNYTNCIFEKNSIGQASQILYGSMTASNCQFIDNFCSVTWSNNINLTDCLFSGNTNNIIGSPGNIQNCSFINNTFGFAESYNLQISNCLFDGNEVGIDESGSSTIANSVFSNNTIAVKLGENSLLTNNTITENGTGVQVRGANPSSAQIMDNQICNNTNYNLENLTDKNFQVNANCFCSSDSTTIENGIYDGYDDITRGLVNYAIYDDSCSSIISYVTKVVLETADLELVNENSVRIYPNPTRDFVTVNMTAVRATIEVIDVQGKILQTSIVENGETVSLASYETGMYILRITTENGTSIHRISKN